MIALLLAAAMAQSAPAAPPVVSAMPAAPAVIDPARLQAAERLLEAMHIDQQYDSMFSRMIPVMTVQVFATLKNDVQVPVALRTELAKPDRAAAAERIFAEQSLRGFKAHYAELKLATARAYAAAFELNELNQIAAFYQTPVDQKTLAVIPALQSKLMPIGMAAGVAVGQEAMRKTVEQMGFAPPRPKA